MTLDEASVMAVFLISRKSPIYAVHDSAIQSSGVHYGFRGSSSRPNEILCERSSQLETESRRSFSYRWGLEVLPRKTTCSAETVDDLVPLTCTMRVANLFCVAVFLLMTTRTGTVTGSSLPPSNCNLLNKDGLCYTDALKERFVFIDSTSRQCHMMVDRLLVEEVLKELSIAGTPPYAVSASRLSALIHVCKQRDPLKQPQDSQKRNLMFPGKGVMFFGTKWCGPGDDADSFDDLGELKELDMCCRDHDHCPENIKHGKTKHNITNTSAFTMSHCDCDDAFHKCLKLVDSEASQAVGFTYFSTGFIKCFRLAPPVEKCLQWSGFFSQTCDRYQFDESGEYKWQVFDLPTF
ncbi:Phospholipase A2 domain [Trinorchestia longiramus]|nr:Phospholipase A2 domain [Trinorchestia longiramus]